MCKGAISTNSHISERSRTWHILWKQSTYSYSITVKSSERVSYNLVTIWWNLIKPVLDELQALLTALAQASQNSGSLCIGHLLHPASSQNRQMYWTNADVSASDHSRFPEDFFNTLPTWNKLFLDDLSVEGVYFPASPACCLLQQWAF